MEKDFKVSCYRCGNWIDLNKYDDRFNFCGEVLACEHCGCPYLATGRSEDRELINIAEYINKDITHDILGNPIIVK